MGLIVKIVIGFVLSLFIFASANAQALKSEAYATVPQLIEASGYPVEKHRVRTQDDYILQMHRIPAGRRRTPRRATSSKGKRAILIVHGLLGSSGDFVLMGPDRSLAYLLADAGYDVWLGNLRGNAYSAHITLQRNDPKFWEYSFHEHGLYDLPAMIDKILDVTKLPKILYIGYSMGTTSFFTMMAQKPAYNSKILSFVALAPAVYMDNVKDLAVLTLRTFNIANTMRSEGVFSATIPADLRDLVISGLCSVRRAQQDICMRLVYSIVGEDYEQNDWDISPLLLARFQPASWQQLEHFGKVAMTGVFTSYDGSIDTLPEPYNLTNVQVPVTLLYGENDQLTHKSQIMRLAKELNSTGMLEDVRAGCGWPKFNHLDFVFARDVGKMLNKPLILYVDKLYNKYGNS